jgi:hypothetical protein
MEEQTKTFRKLILNEEDVDGIAFHIDEAQTNEDRIAWNFTIMKLNEDENKDFYLHELGYKYQIVLYKDEEAEVFEAVLGDVKHYVTNMVNANQEGLVIKKCKKSEEILDKIFRGHLMQALAAGLVQVASAKTEVI